MSRFGIFIVEEDVDLAQALKNYLSENFIYDVQTFANYQEAIANMAFKPDVVCLSYDIDPSSADNLIAKLKVDYPSVPVIVMGSLLALESALFVWKDHVADFLLSDDTLGHLLPKAIARIKETRELRAEIEILKATVERLSVDHHSAKAHEPTTHFGDIATAEKTLDEYNFDIIRLYLKKYNHNVLTVAKKLEIGKSTIYNMLKERELRVRSL